ncbi:MAG: STAS-like domain-containing protein [Gammaproteobacteria bacterium]|uniref:DUF4325 domain-containing protein n=1 Tax=Marinomonas polaris DSM 16579 TaxID=1122206 RepID=A0A1M4WRT6_9GAMM|nr:STAS-like domain-containing protein [Marinomonas polaris]MBU1293724.1 STAS-like domain-containing protein [Gammaproteobacteria bacterium]MBU1468783.1 STAS-like domain-containing protein [Gammaproteobacteria bacterium]MBU2022083.1 STAS-like domain-containing protein [Gammaproteobacteria bacterium]MBU2240412.1 STAS-like domain-containing protein [Gammaproteobacteria bacterium]MBU2320048.1 STAS-like domain-containing protein [Gammaproteobacteria bacterium]
MNTYKMQDLFGIVCGDGTKALAFLKDCVLPSLQEKDSTVFDFDGVRVLSSSFSNALFGNLVLKEGKSALTHIKFVNTSSLVQSEIKSGITLGLSKHSKKWRAEAVTV